MWRAALLVVLVAGAGAADPPGTEASRAALAACERAGAVRGAARMAALRASLARAEEAIAADVGDALAHFAAFCALGKLLRETGLGLAAPARLWRLRREIDRTLALAPDFPDALTGKGVLLVRLPRLLGGDPAEGERLLRRALAIDPEYVRPRLELVTALRVRGAVDEARAEAARALAVAMDRERRDDAATARAELDALDAAARRNP